MRLHLVSLFSAFLIGIISLSTCFVKHLLQSKSIGIKNSGGSSFVILYLLDACIYECIHVFNEKKIASQ